MGRAPRSSDTSIDAIAGLPRLPASFVRRERLDKQLDQLAPLTLLQGLPGTGKTSLVTGWLEQRSPAIVPVLVTATSGTDASSLHRQLTTALVAAGLLDADGSRTWSPGLGVIDDAVARLGHEEHLVLVIDDAHHVTDETCVQGVLDRVQRLRRFHLVVCSHGRHRIADLAVGRIDRCEFIAADLQLTLGEVAELARAHERTLTDEATAELHAAFGGWLAPTRAALETDAVEPFDRTAGSDFVRLHVLPLAEGVAGFDVARRVALARRLDEALVRDLAGPSGTERLEAAGLFRRGVIDGVRVLIMPTAIRAMLRASWADAPDLTAATHRQLATWFERLAERTDRSGDALLAFGHAVDAADWDTAHRVWTSFESRFSMAHAAEYLAVLRSIPQEGLESRLAWRVAKTAMGVAASALDAPSDGGISVISAHLEAARGLPLDDADLPLHDLLYLGTYQMCALRTVDYEAAHDFGEALRRRVDARLARGETAGDRLAFFLLQHAGNKQSLGDHAASDRMLLQAWRLPASSTAPHHRALVASLLANRHAIRGDHAQAQQWVARHDRWQAPGTWGYETIAGWRQTAVAMRALDVLDREASIELVGALGDARGAPPNWYTVCHLLAHLALHFGDPEIALATVTAADAEGDHQYHPVTSAHAVPVVEAELLIGLGRAQQAVQLLRDLPGELPDVSGTRAFALVAVGQFAAARTAVAHVAARPASPRQRLDLALADGVAALHLGDGDTVRRRARHVLGLVRSTGIVRALAKVDRPSLEAMGVWGALGGEHRRALQASPTIYPGDQASIVLTHRERTLLDALRAGSSRQQTATQLYLSLNTVKTQYRDLYRKLGVNSSGQALLKVEQLGLLDDTGVP